MTDQYAKIIQDNLSKLYRKKEIARELAEYLPARREGDALHFDAFSEPCRITPEGIWCGDRQEEGPRGIVISLYAQFARRTPMILEPLKAFKDFPNSMPYVGAFAAYTQEPLVPHVEEIRKKIPAIVSAFDGHPTPGTIGGDFSFLVHPLPKIALCYIFYEADEDFPASVTCLYANNALDFLPIDGAADLGEYTTKKLIELITA